ncbi:poly(A) RNA polymerase, mitochondrial-like [Metopolophium dirhodum]|uniref:poly(A) RNA polymerase, mitochondrial-like n=1 Tax=Metopolophium dirhodum TaxID=44670 RepID=UPI00298FAC8F|nr:poly(A) RNA polymerase, mitochondrial-like [Metopolophium dirhodum]
MNKTCSLRRLCNLHEHLIKQHRVIRYKSNTSNDLNSFVLYDKFICERRSQSKCSVLVQVSSENSCSDLHSYCSKFGSIKNIFHYQLAGSNHYVLTEFEDQSSVNSLLDQSTHIKDSNVIAVRSPFLWFRSNASKKNSKLSIIDNKFNFPFQANQTMIEPNIKDIGLNKLDSLSNQMLLLLKCTQLNDIGTRLRFLTAMQIENALKGIFPLSKVLPFGSSVNSFGKIGSDIDLVIMDSQTTENETSRLIYHGKCVSNSRTQTQRNIEILGDLLQLFLPGCSRVKRISQARVPIVKYSQDFIGVECDLAVSNETAVNMSELLYIFGNFDYRVRPLVFTVKMWAKEINLTNDTPGRWITNFSLTLLVLFYLQQEKIIPDIQTLVKQARNNDVRITNEGINCTFLRDASKLHRVVENKKTLDQLLLGFFEYFASFDFNTNAISLNFGKTINKPEYSALYIVNPLEVHFNVSKNISSEEVERFRIELRNAAWTIDSSLMNTNSFNLLDLFKGFDANKKSQIVFDIQHQIKNSNRLVTVKDLFDDDSQTQEDTRLNKQLKPSEREI